MFILLPFMLGCVGSTPAPATQAVALGKAGKGILYQPSVSGKLPAVIVIPGEAGLTPGVDQFASTLREAGYVALVVDLYRGEKVSQDDILDAHIMSRALDESQVHADLQAAVAFLEARKEMGSLGVVGFDLGGGYALEAALRQPQLRLVVSICGRPITDAALLAPLQAAFLGLYGDKDEGITPESRAAFRTALEVADKRLIDLRVFPQSGNDLLNPPQGSEVDQARQLILDTLERELR
jgi:carboxymethylenebutenolidase